MKAKSILSVLLLWAGLVSGAHAAATTTNSTVGAGGYDLVSYHINKKPLRGNGNHVSVEDGVTYLFANKQNKKTFDNNADKYLPAYGGYCAYGVSGEKKFFGDPEVWRVVDSRLYLNLDVGIQDLWLKDICGHIKSANTNWTKIKNVKPSAL